MALTNGQRVELERKIVRHLIRAMKEDGWNVVKVNDGGDEDEKVSGEVEALEHIFAVDEARAFFEKGDKKAWVLLISGNGIDVISDYTVNHAEFEAVMMNVSTYTDSLES